MNASGGARTRQVLALTVAVGLCVPALLLRLLLGHVSAPIGTLCYGVAFIGAALLLVWGTELAQLELPTGLALSALAVIAILPEYAIDLLFAYQAGQNPGTSSLALANMTGANRLLIGIGWSVVVFVGAVSYHRARRAGGGENGGGDNGAGERHRYAMNLRRLATLDIVVLGAASLYMLHMPMRSTLTLFDSAVLLCLFGFYVFRLARAPQEEPEFIGPPALINRLSTSWRRTVVVVMMGSAALVIVFMAHPLSESIVQTGQLLGLDKFLMVQWVAPLATESAELVPACLFAWRQLPDKGLGTLLSSKINQWTLLVSMVPAAFALAAGSLSGLPMSPTQQHAILLTAAQSLFAMSLLIDLRMSVRQAALILALFLSDVVGSVVLGDDARSVMRTTLSVVYLTLAAVRLVRLRDRIPQVLRDGVRTHPRDMLGEPEQVR
ncbi:sodium:proton exchanger [Qaidamihabitans albus]|uniref:sodium:proton exchanger n=1 Tax=Qaidamihabitans albus TaxID=2795733 RepID=UPI0018F14B90|nr:sodium:proton exchanger [Qaidamihabitans albus]